MNKSALARDFWRKIFDENKIDLRNSDKRNAAVNDFLANPENKKAGWKQADKRFFRLSLDKIFRERGISSHKANIKPISQTTQKQAGSMRMNIKTDEKKVHEAKPQTITTQELKETGQESAPQTEPQQAAYYTSENVAIVFDTMFNLLHTRYPACSKLSMDEKRNIGESWRPIFDKYLADKGGIWIAPILALTPVVLVRVAEYNRELKADEMKKDFFPNDKDKDDKKETKTGDDYLAGR
jgi:predicted amino acid-binding ACT domain protein